MKNFWRAPSRRASVSKRPDSISFLISAICWVRVEGRLMAFDTIDAFSDRASLSAFDAADAAAAADILMRVILLGPSIRPGPPTPSVFPMSIGCLPLHNPSTLQDCHVPRSLTSPDAIICIGRRPPDLKG